MQFPLFSWPSTVIDCTSDWVASTLITVRKNRLHPPFPHTTESAITHADKIHFSIPVYYDVSCQRSPGSGDHLPDDFLYRLFKFFLLSAWVPPDRSIWCSERSDSAIIRHFHEPVQLFWFFRHRPKRSADQGGRYPVFWEIAPAHPEKSLK